MSVGKCLEGLIFRKKFVTEILEVIYGGEGILSKCKPIS